MLLKALQHSRRRGAAARRFGSFFLTNNNDNNHNNNNARDEIVLHVGPTNSGKTYAAMKALRSASCGVYAGPLRLLAWEAHDDMKRRGIRSQLITGLEREIPHHCEHVGGDPLPATHTACTVEMLDIRSTPPWDVCVLDELQMIADENRGWAWTRALLRAPARRLHLCGESRCEDLVRRIVCEELNEGDVFTVKRYERLSSLSVAKTTASLHNVQRGDCIVAFSRQKLYDLKRRIESKGKKQACILYGSLPPELRRSQADLFNSGGSDVLVATDAVGMGLNLNIKRVVFTETEKFDGTAVVGLSGSQIRQIGGRAGRWKSKYPEGIVTALSESDLHRVRFAINENPAAKKLMLKKAGAAPEYEEIETFAKRFGYQDEEYLYNSDGEFDGESDDDGPSFAEMLESFFDHFLVDRSLYFVCDYEERLQIARLLDHAPLSLREKWIFCNAPVSLRIPETLATLHDCAECYAEYCDVEMHLRFPGKIPQTPKRMLRIENIIKCMDVYTWLYNQPAIDSEAFVSIQDVKQARVELSGLLSVGLEAIGDSNAQQISVSRAMRRLKPSPRGKKRRRAKRRRPRRRL